MKNYIELSARLLLASIFLLAGINKISGYTGTQAYMNSQGVPGELLPIVIALEIIVPIMLIVGWQTRLAAIALAGFTLLSAILFHFNFADQTQSIMFMKNLAITGGLLLFFAHGAGNISLDARKNS